MRISEAVHPGGMPSINGATINVGSVAITLNREDYAALAAAISEKTAADLAAAQQVYDRHWERIRAVSEITRELREIFYDGEDDDDCFLRRDLSEVDQERLEKLLDGSADLLGFA